MAQDNKGNEEPPHPIGLGCLGFKRVQGLGLRVELAV